MTKIFVPISLVYSRQKEHDLRGSREFIRAMQYVYDII